MMAGFGDKQLRLSNYLELSLTATGGHLRCHLHQLHRSHAGVRAGMFWPRIGLYKLSPADVQSCKHTAHFIAARASVSLADPTC